MTDALKKKFKKVKLLILDVDGVMTPGKIILDAKGDEIKVFDVQDGFGIVIFKRAGYQTAIITARASAAVAARAKDLKIDYVYQDAHPKINAYKQLLADLDLTDQDACFIGDDLTDLAVMKAVGLGITVPNAVPEIKRAADMVTKKPGGDGAVREVIELILKAQGQWLKVVKSFR